ncbi:protein kinase family protein [Paenibacillus sp. P96]|uniref:Protein kinase family protein n=1 Tax=Paenibacillus zeirhizosphaerae TaxID=2987519 RepID=A0ABT9FMT9_9BACL|nr:protein kinase family protein [Paenibacillus sp. P96]MDP4096013.1 protein kinase family protein [Paenibacillus sp. P96]
MLAYLRRVREAWMDYPHQPGEMIGGRYKVVRLLGIGSYGLTYLCTDTESGKSAAVKQAKPSKRARAVKLLQREADILQQMHHRCIPQYIEWIAPGRNKVYMVSEYIEGSTLEDLIFEQEQRFTETECILYTLKLLERVRYVHEQGFVHMDIRIPNVIQRAGEPWLIDFGLALGIGEDSQEVFPGSMMHARDPQRRDAQMYSDLYDIGHFMLFMLYSSYNPAPGQEPAEWQEELRLHPQTRHFLERLLQIGPRYEDSAVALQDLRRLSRLLQ